MLSLTELKTLSNGEAMTWAAHHSAIHSFFNAVPQSNSLDLVDSEAVFTAFANACAQAGAKKCLLAGMIQGTATGSGVWTLITSTIDVSLFIPMYPIWQGF